MHVYNGERVRLPARTRVRYAVEGRLKESETGPRVFRRVKHALIRRVTAALPPLCFVVMPFG